MLSGLMKKMAMAGADKEDEQEGPEEASLSDLIGMLEEVIAKKGMSKKKPEGEMSITMIAGEPKEGEGEMMGEGSPFEKSKVDMEDDEEEMKKAKFFK